MIVRNSGSEVEAAILDALELARLITERAVFEEDPVRYIRRRIEVLQLELSVLAVPDGAGGAGG